MIHAIRNGQKADFSEHVWDLLPPGKEGWEQVKAEPTEEVKAAVKKQVKAEPTEEVKL